MPNEREAVVAHTGEVVERLLPKETEKLESPRKQFEDFSQRMRNESCENPPREFSRTVEAFREWLGERLGDAKEVLGATKDALERAQFGETEIGKQLIGGLEKGRAAIEDGRLVLREHSEAFDAIVKLIVLGVFLVAHPEAMQQLLAQQPELLAGPLKTLFAEIS